MSWTDGPNGLEKDRPMARLQEELARVKAPLRYPERTAKEASFGCSPPSSKGRVKPDALPERQPHRGGPRRGIRGMGERRSVWRRPTAWKGCRFRSAARTARPS